MDFFTRVGTVRVRVASDALPATELGLEADGTRTVEPLVPVTVVVLSDAVAQLR